MRNNRMTTDCVKITIVLAILFGELYNYVLTHDHNEAKVPIYVTARGDSERLRRSAEEFPKELEARFMLYDDYVNLRLKRSDNVRPNVGVYVWRDGQAKQREVPRRKHHVFYQDTGYLASIAVGCHDSYHGNETCKNTLNGYVMVDGKYHVIEPVVENQRRSDVFYTPVQHIIRVIQHEFDFISDYIYPDFYPFQNLQMSESTDHHRTRRSTTDLYVELFPVVDYHVYNFWFNRSTASTPAEKDLEALDDVREFYANVINVMDVRYKSIQASYSITIVYNDIFISDSPASSNWTENNKTPASPRDEVDPYGALDEFNAWLQTTTGLPDFDHGMLFTGSDLAVNESTAIAGLAFLGGLCRGAGSSIVEDHFEAIIGVLAAHELGHNLNALHDGEENNCSSEDFFVMAESAIVLTDSRSLNHFTFSNCSVDYFEAYITDVLDRDGINCMAIFSSGYDPDAAENLTIPLGQLYSLDEQCQLIMGNSSSYFCRVFHEDPATVCEYIYCSLPENASVCSPQMPWEGTQCGNKMMCVEGQCVEDDIAAATISETCIFGDSPVLIPDELGCSDVVEVLNYLCYPEFGIFDICCESCLQVQSCEIGCEYGDIATVCDPALCSEYDNDTLSLCCSTCATTSIGCDTTYSSSTTEATTTSTAESTSTSTTELTTTSTTQPTSTSTTEATTTSTIQPTTSSTTESTTISTTETTTTTSTTQPTSSATTESTTTSTTEATTTSTTQPTTSSTIESTTTSTTEATTTSTTLPTASSTTESTTTSTTEATTTSTTLPTTSSIIESTTATTEATTTSTTLPTTSSATSSTIATTDVTTTTTLPTSSSTTESTTTSTTEATSSSTTLPTTSSTIESTTTSTTEATTTETTQPTTTPTVESTTTSTTQPTTTSTAETTATTTTQRTTTSTVETTTTSTTQPTTTSTAETATTTTQPTTTSTAETTTTTTQSTTTSTVGTTTTATTQPTTTSTVATTTTSTTQPTTTLTTGPTTASTTETSITPTEHTTTSTVQQTTRSATKPSITSVTQPTTTSVTVSTTAPISSTSIKTTTTTNPTTTRRNGSNSSEKINVSKGLCLLVAVVCLMWFI